MDHVASGGRGGAGWVQIVHQQPENDRRWLIRGWPFEAFSSSSSSSLEINENEQNYA